MYAHQVAEALLRMRTVSQQVSMDVVCLFNVGAYSVNIVLYIMLHVGPIKPLAGEMGYFLYTNMAHVTVLGL